MTDLIPSDEGRQRIFDEEIVPVVFPHAPAAERPSLVLLAGHPGDGRARATARLLDEHPDGLAVVRADDLRVFHPRFVELARSRSSEAQRILAESTAGWLQQSVRYARTTGRSLLLDGTFSAEAAIATTGLFARHGFTTRVVVVATPRSESLLAEASRYLLEYREGGAARFTSVETHDAARRGVHSLVAALEETPDADRVTLLGRDGTPRFDAYRTDPASFAGARAALERAESAPLSAAVAMRWMSELRAATDDALDSAPSRQLAEVLIELHEIALNDVLPRIPLPLDSKARSAAETTLARRLVSLRRAVPVEPRSPDLAAPVISIAQPDRGISR